MVLSMQIEIPWRGMHSPCVRCSLCQAILPACVLVPLSPILAPNHPHPTPLCIYSHPLLPQYTSMKWTARLLSSMQVECPRTEDLQGCCTLLSITGCRLQHRSRQTETTSERFESLFVRLGILQKLPRLTVSAFHCHLQKEI